MVDLQTTLFAAAISEVPVVGPYQVLGGANIDMYPIYFFINDLLS